MEKQKENVQNAASFEQVKSDRPQRSNNRQKFNKDKKQVEETDDLQKKTIDIRRVTKVVKGGRTMRFSALVVVGDGKGNVGIGMGKAAEVPMAIEKANQKAKRNMVPVPIIGTTIPHEIVGKYGKGSVLLKPAQPGTGVIAGGSVRGILEVCGYKDIRTKCLGSTNSFNCVKATMNGLLNLKTIEQVAKMRGKSVEELSE